MPPKKRCFFIYIEFIQIIQFSIQYLFIRSLFVNLSLSLSRLALLVVWLNCFCIVFFSCNSGCHCTKKCLIHTQVIDSGNKYHRFSCIRLLSMDIPKFSFNFEMRRERATWEKPYWKLFYDANFGFEKYISLKRGQQTLVKFMYLWNLIKVKIIECPFKHKKNGFILRPNKRQHRIFGQQFLFWFSFFIAEIYLVNFVETRIIITIIW